MKKLMIALVAMLAIAAKGNAMSYEQARNEALFLTDKMAYELNLTDEQYEAAYEINLDYLMGVTSYDDVYGDYWERRNLDLSYILLDWQWRSFCAASYFYRPLYWRDGFWHFGIYARYPHRDYFYFGRPVFYASYRGGHAWHVVGGRGYYYGRRDHFRPVAGRAHFGMLDRWNRGDFRNNHNRGASHFGGHRNSSTRTTVNDNRHLDRSTQQQSHRRFGTSPSQPNNRGIGSTPTQRSHGSTTTNRAESSRSHGTFSNSGSNQRARTFGNNGNSSSYSSGATHSSGSFSGGSHSSGATRSGGSFSGGSHGGSSSGSGHSTGGGRSFGGRR